MAFWRCSESAILVELCTYDEGMFGVQGCYTLLSKGKPIPINAGEEYVRRTRRSPRW